MSLDDTQETKYDVNFLKKVDGLLQTLYEDYPGEDVRFSYHPFDDETYEDVYRKVKELVEEETPDTNYWTKEKVMYLTSNLVRWNYMRKVKKMSELQLTTTEDEDEKMMVKWALTNRYYDFNDDVFHLLVKMFGSKDKSWVWKLTSYCIGKNHIIMQNLGSYPNLTHLDLCKYGCTSLDIVHLSCLTGLVHLDISRNQLQDISPIAGLTGLMSLNLSYNCITNLSHLSGLVNLKTLNLSVNEFNDISPLSNLVNLEHLILSQNKITILSPLSHLVHLTTLELFFIRVRDISPLRGLINLTHLELCCNSDITDISPLSNLTKLEYLDLRADTNIVDLSPLSGLTNLKRCLRTL